ncbi:hypothetical protein [Streptomyces sp. NBC_00154]|uniref:hypothetical protein n=1 Tax=Streptomyces sp. NBC_00154 TaxID=2975670 RepID=UPI00225179B4|nr:hypothetical protein [Streptomyces sp. NBC_00154]MCX5310687.1 hypothetical protein [Streptomyces sp. NBC_00154]
MEWQKIATQATGPVLSAVILGLVAAWIARRAQLRKEQWSLRHELIREMTETASTLYNETLRFARATRYFSATSDEKEKYRKDLDRRYNASRICAEVIQDRLDAYFATNRAKCAWHRAMDLLSMQYFLLITDFRLPQDLVDRYSGDEHTGLTERSDLQDLAVLRSGYHHFRQEATEAVLADPFVGEWIGVRASLSALASNSESISGGSNRVKKKSRWGRGG